MRIKPLAIAAAGALALAACSSGDDAVQTEPATDAAADTAAATPADGAMAPSDGAAPPDPVAPGNPDAT